ncbi:MAG: precorrin-2 C(20)-methyltransferase [Clostridiales bacterium]|jgi:precorrin-2/cobalt-factor-2 C20-methyltransferase|nr:precorrin-2 C(20)-methyltransferase [Clostridiales bacterium]
MIGTLYGVGIGPGDPELITLKAARIIRQCPILAVPQTGDSRQVALSIASQAIADLEQKEILSLPFPMTKNQEELDRNRDRIAGLITAKLLGGHDVAFLTLGDPTVYSTYWYIHQRILEQNLSAEIIPGVPSFCAVAAKLNTALAEADQPIHILPASYPDTEAALSQTGTKVLMKMGKQLESVKEMLKTKGLYHHAKMVQNCGLEQELVCQNLDDAGNAASYFSIILVKEETS